MFAAYGWLINLTDQEILARLLELIQERSRPPVWSGVTFAVSLLRIVIPTGADYSRREWSAEWRDLEFFAAYTNVSGYRLLGTDFFITNAPYAPSQTSITPDAKMNA